MKNTFKFVASLVLTMFALQGNAAILTIDFNGIEFNLGSFESAQTGAQFYGYDNPSASSANPRYPDNNQLIPLQVDTLHVFSHVNSANGELSFGIILEKPNGSGGGTFQTLATWSDPARLALVDDPNEFTATTNTSANVDLRWIDCCTDGFVISGFDQNDLFLNLANTRGSDLTQVVFLSPNRQNRTFAFPTNQFNISIQNCDPATDPNNCVIPDVPEPSNLALLALGLLGLGLRKRKLVR